MEEDLVERVARAIYEERFKGKNVMPFDAFRTDHARPYARLEAQARAAISAFPLDHNRIREIKERHEADAKTFDGWMHDPGDGKQAHEDRAFLLQQIGKTMGGENGD